MKKVFFVAILLVSMDFLAFSQIEESWASIGFEFGNSFVKYPDEKVGYLGAPGFNVNVYQFSNMRNIGIFFHFAALFPAIEKHNNINYLFQYEWMFGPGFRYSLNNNLYLHFGIGLNVTSPLYATYNKESVDYHFEATNLGIGSDVGLKFNFSDKYYLNFGLALAYDFISFKYIESRSNDGNTRTRISDNFYIMDFGMLGIRPYIGIGINAYGERVKYGRPPKN